MMKKGERVMVAGTLADHPTYGGRLTDLVAQSRHAAETAEPDVGCWFKVINPRMKTYTLMGPCVGVHRNSYQQPWDLLLIEFGSGRRRWIRRQNLYFVTF